MTITLKMDGQYPKMEIPEEFKGIRLTDTKDTVALAKGLEVRDIETVLMITLDRHDFPIAVRLVSVGGSDRACLSTRVMVTEAVRDGAKGVVLVHNHPGGSPAHSNTDDEFCEFFRKQLDVLEIELVDSIVISQDGRYASEFYSRRREPQEKKDLTKPWRMLRFVIDSLIYCGEILKEIGLVLFATLAFFMLAEIEGTTVIIEATAIEAMLQMMIIFPISVAALIIGRFAKRFVYPQIWDDEE